MANASGGGRWPTLDFKPLIDDYFHKGLAAKENANMSTMGPAGLLLVVGGAALRVDYLHRLREAGFGELVDLHETGRVHIHDLTLGYKTPYCAGHSLQNLLSDGISAGAIKSGPAKRLRSAVNHIINYIGASSNEFAGAQAFNDVDLFLGPYACDYYMHILATYKSVSEEDARAMVLDEVRQSTQEMIFHLNYNTRYGGQCVTPDTECLTPKGWKTHEELCVGDEIFVVDTETGEMRTDTLTHVNVYDFSGNLLRFKGRCADILVTPNHRMVYRKSNVDGKLGVLEAAELAERAVINIPNTAALNRPDNPAWSDDRVRMLAWVLSDAHMETGRYSRIRIYQTEKKFAEEIRALLSRLGIAYTESEDIGEWGSEVVMFGIHGGAAREWIAITGGERNRIPASAFDTFSARQAKLFLDEYIKADGHIEANGRTRISKKYETMIDDLQHMAVLAGIGTTLKRRAPGGTSTAHAVALLKHNVVSATEVTPFSYTGKVWCPTTATGTFVARRNNKVFITGNSPFSNISLALDVPSDMANQRPLIGGKTLEERWSMPAPEHADDEDATYASLSFWQNMVAEAILDNFMRGDIDGKGFTFPVLSINAVPELFTHPLKDKVFALSARFGNPYYQNYVNGYSGDNKLDPSDVRSMCPMKGNTKVLIKTGKCVSVQEIRQVANNYERDLKTGRAPTLQVRHNGMWYNAKPVSVEPKRCRTYKLRNGVTVTLDDRHEQPMKSGKGSPMRVLVADELATGNYLPFNAIALDTQIHNYIAGFAVGAFIGDGCYTGNNAKQLNYSLNTGFKEGQVFDKVKSFFESMGFNTSDALDGKVHSLRVWGHSGAARSWMSQFVEGDSALNKRISNVAFNRGAHFLRGLLDGWYNTDGGNRGRIYAASEGLREGFQHICGSLGVHYNVSDKPDEREDRLGDTHSPVWTCKFHTRASYGSDFFFENGYYWFPIEEIEEYKPTYNEKFYCFAVESEEHLFQLANGLVTHNCRLQLDKSMIRKHTGGAFGNGDQTGSIIVITQNYPMIAMDACKANMHPDDAFNAFVAEVTRIGELIKEMELWKREVVTQSWKEGFFPMAQTNLRRGFDTFYTTIGFVGLWEAVEVITGNSESFLTEYGLDYAKRVLQHGRGMAMRFSEETDTLFNFEATPAESAAYKLCLKMLRVYPDAPHRGTKEAPYLTNSCHLPVEYNDNVPALLHTQSVLQPIISGGTVVHLHTGEKLTVEGVEAMVRTMCETRIPFFSVSPVYSRCACCGRIIPGDHEYCPYEHTDEQIEALRKSKPWLLVE